MYFAFDAEDLAPYRSMMQESGLKDFDIVGKFIFDVEYTPCTFSGAFNLTHSMKTYRSINDSVGRSWECDLIQGLNNKAAFAVMDVLEKRGTKEAVSKMFGYYNWPVVSKENSLDMKIKEATEKNTKGFYSEKVGKNIARDL